MNLKDRLRNCIKKLESSADYVHPEKRLEIEVEHFKAEYKPSVTNDHPSYKTIPRFFRKLPELEERLAQKLREEARSALLNKKSSELLENGESKQLLTLLDKNNMLSNGEEHHITYAEFKKIGEKVDKKIKPFFTATVFAKLQRENHGTVALDSLFHYIMRKMWLSQIRIGLSVYDNTGQGYLTEQNLREYIANLVPTLPSLEAMDSSFESFYECTASRKFLFFLDPFRTGRVRIIDILASNFLDDIVELRDENLSKEVQERNWFSIPSALRVYGQYLNLDKDRNGMLSIDELQDYGSGTLTRTFLKRVFQQCLMYQGEMDYKTYLDLVLALEYRREPQSLHYLFRVLDIHGKGYLDGFTLNYFFKAIQEQVELHSPVNFEDVKDEIFDMIRPADPTKITLRDLINSGHGGTAVGMLIEVHSFLQYEHRESIFCLVDNT